MGNQGWGHSLEVTAQNLPMEKRMDGAIFLRWFTKFTETWQYFSMKHPKRVDVANIHDCGHVNYWYVNAYSCLFYVPHSRLKTFKRGVARVRELTKDINQFWEVWGQVGYGILVIFLAFLLHPILGTIEFTAPGGAIIAAKRLRTYSTERSQETYVWWCHETVLSRLLNFITHKI